MEEIEIKEIPPLAPNEQSVLDFHSVVNIANVLHWELVVLGLTFARDERLLAEGLALCREIIASLGDRALALRHAAEIEALERAVLAEIDRKITGEAAQDPLIVETQDNLRAVFVILRVRARELLARAAAPERWETVESEGLRRNLAEVFTAIERNSHGRYRILYNAARTRPHDYYVDLRIESDVGTAVRLPAVLQDVMRDLVANARKYTPPGGHITAALYSDRGGVRFVVRDDGCGIPPAEIRAVVAFGKRASNVAQVRTMGGGFGLTKAFLVTKQFGGRFWIASELGRGTRVRLWIPAEGTRTAPGSASV